MRKPEYELKAGASYAKE